MQTLNRGKASKDWVYESLSMRTWKPEPTGYRFQKSKCLSAPSSIWLPMYLHMVNLYRKTVWVFIHQTGVVTQRLTKMFKLP